MVSWADSGITQPSDWEGKRVGTWGYGNEFELTAAIELFGVTVDGELVQQPFDMSLLLNDQYGCRTGDDLQRVRTGTRADTNPDTGALYTADDLNVIDFNDVGTAMLQGRSCGRMPIGSPKKAMRRSPRSSCGLRSEDGIFCRDNFDECVQIVLDNGPALGAQPPGMAVERDQQADLASPAGIGVMDQFSWTQTVTVATGRGVITAVPPDGSYRIDLAEAALATRGRRTRYHGCQVHPREVTLSPGG